MDEMDAVPSTASRWFAAQLKRNAFVQVERTLSLMGVRALAPKLQRITLRYGKRRSQLSLMFPGYLFVEGADETKLWRAIRATEGRARLLLNSSKQVKQVPPDFMDALLARYDFTGLPHQGQQLTAGASVSVISGPFSGLITKIEHVDEQQRIWILLDLLGAERRVEFQPKDLVPIKQRNQ